jgi:hypothetical protein
MAVASCGRAAWLRLRTDPTSQRVLFVTRPAFADDQLSWDGAARVTFELKTPWRDGTNHLEMTP